MERVRAGAILAIVVLLRLAPAEEKGVRWSTIDPFCGQLVSAEPREFPIKTATVRLYRAKAKHLPCCDQAEPLGTMHVDSKGNFDFRKASPGQYWLVATWEKAEVPVALWYDGKYQYACSENFKNVIEVRPTSKTAEVTVITSNDSLTHAQTN
jgi:hypothetical protein